MAKMKLAIEFEGSIYTFHATGEPTTVKTNCELCDARCEPLCNRYSAGLEHKAMCVLLGSIIRRDEKLGERGGPQGYWKRRTFES